MKERPVSLIRMISDAGEDDLHSVETRIAEIKADIDKFVEARKAELASLQMVRKILDRKLHPKQKTSKESSAAPEKKNNRSDLANEIYDLIARDGSMPSAVIATKLGRTAAQIGACAWRSAWFEMKNGEVHIAKAKG